MNIKTLFPYLFAGLLITVLFLGFTSGKTREKDPKKGFALIELYTSEGCSSCPPADALVAKVLAENKDKPVYVLGYHVDYWNRLGWKDVYSKAEFSNRQRQYAGLLHSQVYTPQIVVNGETAFVGSNHSALRKAIANNLSQSGSEDLSLNGKISGKNELAISYQLKGASDNSILYLALVKKNAISDVESGENSGRKLHHVNIVESLQEVPLKNGNGSVKINLKNNTAADISVIGFIQDKSSGSIKAASECRIPLS